MVGRFEPLSSCMAPAPQGYVSLQAQPPFIAAAARPASWTGREWCRAGSGRRGGRYRRGHERVIDLSGAPCGWAVGKTLVVALERRALLDRAEHHAPA